MNYSELLQLAKGWGNFKFYRIIIWRLRYVDENRQSYKIDNNSFDSSAYEDAVNISVGDMMYSAAKHAKGLASAAQEEITYASAGEQSVEHAIQTVTQYIYKFGNQVGIY